MYAVLDDLALRFERPGNGELTQLAITEDGELDVAKISAHLTEASGEMDAYIGVRHALPLAGLSLEGRERLTQVCCDIARYRLWADAASEEVVRRYREAIDWLQAVADGRIRILPPPAGGPPGASASAEPRLMTRAGLRGVL